MTFSDLFWTLGVIAFLVLSYHFCTEPDEDDDQYGN